ncbi:hypothetical protein P885DRAFT_73900 [Corynascus similis CBS 632.67]
MSTPADGDTNNNRGTKSSDSNPFIRFKQRVDSNIHAGLSTLMGSGGSGSGGGGGGGDSDSSSGGSGMSGAGASRGPDSNTSSSPTSTGDQMSSLSMLTPSEQHLESRIALLAGGTPAEASLAWRLFLTRSPYSPLRLEHDPYLGRPGWKPVPRDHVVVDQSGSQTSSSRGWEDRSVWEWGEVDFPAGSGSEVGWLEAFEDLMRVSSGLEMADLGGRFGRHRENHQQQHVGFLGGGWGGHHPWWHDRGLVGFAGGWFGGMREVAWLERMRSRGLTEVLFPVYDPGMGYQSPRTMAEWVERRRAEEKREREAGRVWEELLGEGRRAVEEADAWADEAKKELRKEIDWWRDAADEKGSSFFDGIGSVVKTLGKVLEDEVKSLHRFGKERSTKHKDEDAVEKDEKAPETENDLYSVIQSAFHESERSLSNFFKSIAEGRRSDTLAEPKPASPPKVNTTEVVEDGITKKTTKKEFVDEHGNTHSKTETTWTDEDGNVIMRQVHSSMGRSERWEKTTPPTPARQDTETSQEPKEPPKEGGWFWK